MSVGGGSANDRISQLNAARNLARGDATYYPQIVPGVLPIIGANASLDLRRWGSEFLAETFATPTLSSEQKQQLSIGVLQTLKEYLEIPDEDTDVVKFVVQTAASVYPLVFRHIISNRDDATTWQRMAAIKSNILRRTDTAPAGVRICCIKFIQRVVQVQTPGMISDPRRPEQNEISLALVPRDHPLIPPPNLEAEASGLLDRLLGILQDDVRDALLVTASLNTMGVLIRTRASIANKIISNVLNFNPLKGVVQPITPRMRVVVRSMERTTRALLTNIIKRNPNHPLAGRIQLYLERLHQTRLELFDESNRKRPAPTEPTDGLGQAKRQKLGAEVSIQLLQDQVGAASMPAGPISVAELFTLTQDPVIKALDVGQVPIDLVARILVPVLRSIDPQKLNNALNVVRSRYLSLSKPQPASALDAAAAATGRLGLAPEESEDYEPDFPAESSEQVENRLDGAPTDDLLPAQPLDIALGSFNLPQPPPLTEQETEECGKDTVTRVFGIVAALEEAASTRSSKTGINRLAASNHDREAWITIVTRLATRAPGALEEGPGKVKMEDDGERNLRRRGFSLSDTIRESLYLYILEDFRKRIAVAISWLNEEWYNDRIQKVQGVDALPHYNKWSVRMLDGISPYLDPKDKVLIRFLSEIPAVTKEMLERVKRLARDPERVSLAVSAIYYLILVRPPVREMCIDAMEDLWKNYDDARSSAAKYLAKWRPQVLQSGQVNAGEDIKTEYKPPAPANGTLAA